MTETHIGMRLRELLGLSKRSREGDTVPQRRAKSELPRTAASTRKIEVTTIADRGAKLRARRKSVKRRRATTLTRGR